MKFYKCSICGNMIAYTENKGIPVTCCGEEMKELIPNTVDASNEKHVPIVKTDGNKVHVTIGAAPHPMTEEHHIAWVALETKEGNQRKELPLADPEVSFMLCDEDQVVSAYAYCNLHGLWKS
ncbi:desulfoferrodoxin family protein [Lachnospiraceae bacterium LCP25S3_G4]